MSEQLNLSNENGSLLSIVAWIIAIFVVMITLFYSVFGTVVPPDYIGVRRNYFSFGILHEGYEPKGLPPGLHLKFPGISDILLLPRGFQFVNLNRETYQGDLDLGTLEVHTADGSKVNTDVTLVVRLYEMPETDSQKDTGAAHKKNTEINNTEISAVPLPTNVVRSHGGPSDLITYYRDTKTQQLTKFSQIAQDELRRTLSALSTTDFYNPELREKAATSAHESINQKVSSQGIELWGTLIRRYTYQDAGIDNQIFAKNLQYQTEKLQEEKTKLQVVTSEIDKVIEHWNAKIKSKIVEGENYLIDIESQARLYEESKIAEGEKEVRVKQAEITAQKNRLLAELSGSDIYIARDLLPLLRSLSGGIVNNIDPYNIDEWVNRLTSTKVTAGGK